MMCSRSVFRWVILSFFLNIFKLKILLIPRSYFCTNIHKFALHPSIHPLSLKILDGLGMISLPFMLYNFASLLSLIDLLCWYWSDYFLWPEEWSELDWPWSDHWSTIFRNNLYPFLKVPQLLPFFPFSKVVFSHFLIISAGVGPFFPWTLYLYPSPFSPFCPFKLP